MKRFAIIILDLAAAAMAQQPATADWRSQLNRARMVQKLDPAETTRYCQGWFKDAMPTLRGDFLAT
jgi:hypothetical protein